MSRRVRGVKWWRGVKGHPGEMQIYELSELSAGVRSEIIVGRGGSGSSGDLRYEIGLKAAEG